ncbi:hypothetical protein LTR36_008842 [Oleoguttula mirabilis]|uniref:C-CAP/cofactor C-like domain-containing protein n=1 Tax=Oleoguttula mirabilis TaxID=1507867 RepID=A0AAV9J879_9PEZI|nr:hypothetical protein LTR36_008842 [Oleoguttula mirabilis]
MDAVSSAAAVVTPYQLPELTREISNSEKFFKYFQHGVTSNADLQEQMDRLQAHGASGGERADAVSHCQAGIARLSDAVKDASSIIPAYDQRSYGEAIKALSAKLEQIRSTFAPRPKFSFKSGTSFPLKKNASAISISDAAELASQKRRQVPGYTSDTSSTSSMATTPAYLQSPAPERADESSESANKDMASGEQTRVRQFSFSQSTAVKINDHDGLHIILPPSAGHATSSGTLSNLRRCVVDMNSPTSSGHPFATLTLKNIKTSLIICGHVSGAVHLTNVSNSVIVVASRQFRMHESHNCDVYLLTTSRPIIEDCSAIHFAPLPDQYLTDGEKEAKNQWNQVDDFKWLRSEPSPNWRVLDMPHRVRDGVWRDVVPGGPEAGVEEILKAVNVAR